LGVSQTAELVTMSQHQVTIETASGVTTKLFPTYNKAYKYVQTAIWSGIREASELSGAGVMCEGKKSMWYLPSKNITLEEI
jgi:hypothetical protein